jgi:cellulase
MLSASSFLIVAASLVSQVAAHGYVPFIKINGQTTAGWDVTKGED